jgi:Rieske Fe-S protein
MSRGPTRRQFLELATNAVAAGLAAFLAGCDDTLRGAYARAAAAPVPVGPRRLTALASLTPTPTAIPFVTADGGEVVYAYSEGGQPVVLSSLCTHRGCTVRWDEPQGRFACPCHEGWFDRQGKVLGGPPLAPLTSYPARKVGDDLFIEG